MKKLALIFALLFSTPSLAEWTNVSKNVDGDVFYVDFDIIRKHDGYLYYWVLTDYLKPSQSGTLSATTYWQGDCKLFRHKTLSFSFYKQPMGRGSADVQEPTKEFQGWQYPPPSSLFEETLKSVCSH
jgi:hypothetical protein